MTALDALSVLFAFAGGVVGLLSLFLSSPFARPPPLPPSSSFPHFSIPNSPPMPPPHPSLLLSLQNTTPPKLKTKNKTGLRSQTRRPLLLLHRLHHQQRHHQRRQRPRRPRQPHRQPRQPLPRGPGRYRIHLVRVRGLLRERRVELFGLEEGRGEVR